MKKFQKYLTLAILIFSCPNLFAQKLQNHEGDFNVLNNKGTANYSFYISKGDTIINGPFKFQKISPLHNLNKELIVLHIEGNFKNNLANGAWTMRKGKFIPTGTGEIINYSLISQIRGTEYFVFGNFINGKADGVWKVFEGEVKGSVMTDTILYASIPFNMDIPSGKLIFRKGKIYFEGDISEEGFAKGKWIFNWKDDNQETVVEKEWIFENNQLVRKNIVIKDEKLTVITASSPWAPSQIVEMELDEQYLRIIDLKAALNNDRAFNIFQEENKARRLYSNALSKFQVPDNVITAVTNSSIIPVIKAKIEKFPYSGQEVNYLSESYKNFTIAKNIIDSVENNHHIRLSSPEINEYLGVLRYVNKIFLQPLDSLMALYVNKDMEFINRNKLISGIMKNIPGPEEISRSENLQAYKFESLDLDFSREPVRQLMNFSTSLLEVVGALQDTLKYFIAEKSEQKGLIEMEADLIAQYEKLESLAETLISIQHIIPAGFNVHSAIITFIEDQLTEYSYLPTTHEQTKRIKQLINCFYNMEKLIFSVKELPVTMDIVKKSYTRSIFNPWLVIYMDEVVKEPVYQAYRKILLPGLIKNLQHLECEKIEGYSGNFNLLYEGMIDLLQKDTQNLERKIRKTTDARKIATLLNFNLNF